MKRILGSANVFTEKGFVKQDILIDSKRLHLVFSKFDIDDAIFNDCSDLFIFPGFVDVHVHLREPGFFYKEDIKSGTYAAAHGGYTAVCAMPNLNPAPSDLESLREELISIEEKALIRVYPYGTITKGRKGKGVLSDMESMKDYVCAFSDDGTGVQTEELMEEAMLKANSLDKIIVAHCEDERELKNGGCIHDGEFAALHGYIGINSESEWKQVKRDIRLASKTGCKYHICHVSTKESVRLIREAKKRGVKVTAETAPHYLIFNDTDLKEDGSWKMNPPIRSEEDRLELLKGVKDGTIDCIITDHAPHSEEEKSKGLANSAFGIVGLENAFSAMYEYLVKTGEISLEKLIELMCINPRKIFNIPGPLYIKDGELADICIMDLSKEFILDSREFYSKGKSTLFNGMRLSGETVATFVEGKKVYDREKGIIDERLRI